MAKAYTLYESSLHDSIEVGTVKVLLNNSLTDKVTTMNGLKQQNVDQHRRWYRP